eukprot:23164-Pleurochrysis_carterae.AAC.1
MSPPITGRCAQCISFFVCIYGRGPKCVTLRGAARRTPARRTAARTPRSQVGRCSSASDARTI